MSNEAISIIAVLKAKPGQQDALRQALQALAESLPISVEHYGPWLTLINVQ